MKLETFSLNTELSPILQAAEESQAPQWVELIPPGINIVGRDGRSWLNDKPTDVVQAFNASAVDLPIDIEHASEHKAPQGDPAPAMAWVKQLEARENGSIWGLVEWNREGDTLVTSKQYRYLSPVFFYEKDSRRITRLSSVGLTNKPNLHLKALNQRQPTEEHSMDEELLAALGLQAGATRDDVKQAINQLKNSANKALNQQDLSQFVPRTDYDKAINRAQTAEQTLREHAKQARDAEIDQLVDQALKDGVITPASVEYHKTCCRQEKGLEVFKQYIQQAPKILADMNQFQGKPPEGTGELNSEDKAACQLLGLTEDEFKSSQKDQ